jgi:UDP-3-O-[3-hydroxymyristoyl] N-acetylglucosamine deacetylase
VAIAVAGRPLPVVGLRVAAVDHATTVDIEGSRVATVEHLLGACAGMGVHEGLLIEIHGDEAPLLDGGARLWCELLAELDVRPSPPPLVVLEQGVVEVGASRYTFAVGARQLRVRVDYGDARLSKEASWAGDAEDFRGRIAPARTFLVAPEEIHWAGRPFEADEPARHKLLDLAGDLFLYGGPPEGTLEAVRPGHGATHEAMRVALERGLVGYR